MKVREKQEINQWFKFFLMGVIETAKNSISTFDKVLKLQKDIETRIQGLGSRSVSANTVVKQLCQHPVIQARKVQEITGLSMPTAYKIIEGLEELKVLKEVTGAKRGKLYFFKEYIDLFSTD